MNAETLEIKLNALNEKIEKRITLNAKLDARKFLDANKMYMNPETGSVDTGEGWIQDCIDTYNGFPREELASLCEVRKTVTADERRVWGDWMQAE